MEEQLSALLGNHDRPDGPTNQPPSDQQTDRRGRRKVTLPKILNKYSMFCTMPARAQMDGGMRLS